MVLQCFVVLYKYALINPNVKSATSFKSLLRVFWKNGVHEETWTIVSDSKHFLCSTGQWFERDRGASHRSDSQLVLKLKGLRGFRDWTTEVWPSPRLMCTTHFRRTCCQLQQSGYLSHKRTLFNYYVLLVRKFNFRLRTSQIPHLSGATQDLQYSLKVSWY